MEVGKWVHCIDNELTSLEGCPSEVGENFNCSNNLLTDLDTSANIIGDLFCWDNEIDRNHCNFYGHVGGKIWFLPQGGRFNYNGEDATDYLT